VDLTNWLAGRGHAVHVFARHSPLGIASFRSNVTFHGLDGDDGQALHRLDVQWPGRDVKALADRVVSVANTEGLDVLHVHYAVPFARVGCEVQGRLDGSAPRLVVTLHGTDVSVHGTDPLKGAALARSLSRFDAVTTVSRSHGALAARILHLKRSPLVIPNFVDPARFRPAEELDGPSRPARIVHVSNFRAVKDPAAVGRIFVRVRRHIPAELWLVGDGDGMPALRAVVREAGLEPDVRAFGLRREVEAILPSADLMLMTSREESFCLAALEASACGVPVVAPRVGGLSEVVVHEETGVLFPPGDEEEAAVAALRLLRDPARRSAMGRAAVARARTFASHLIAPRYEELYRLLLDSSRRPALLGRAP